MEKLEQIIATYQQIIQKAELELQSARKRIYYISLLRLVLFVGAIAGAVTFWADGWLYISVFAILPFILFVWLVKRHNFWFHRKDFLKKKIVINEQELRAIQYDFSDFEDGEEYIDSGHLYTFDLDVFGEHSLFQYINRTSTPVGKQHLADWFNSHLENKEAIEQRQEAIRELSTELEYRQQIRLLGLLYKGKPADTTEIKTWADSPSYYRKHTLLRIIPITVSIINLVCISLAFSGILPASAAGGVFISFVIFSSVFSKGITKLQTTYGKKLQILSTYADQILLTEKKEMHSPILQQLKAELTSQNQTASQAVRQLSKLMNALDQRSNLLMSTILNGLIFWELRQVMRIEQWKDTHAKDLPRWIETIGEIDAYCSLATFAYNHPEYIYPKICSQSFHLQAKGLGHPLMDRSKCVRNGIDIDKRPFFIIITGSEYGR